MKTLAFTLLCMLLFTRDAMSAHDLTHDLVMDRFFKSIALVYKTSRACDLNSGYPDHQTYTDTIRDYLNHYYINGIPFWVLPRDQDIQLTNNCEKKLSTALSNYRLARNDFEEFFPEAPVPPSLMPVRLRDIKRKPQRSFNIAG
ncbi:MAG: hypothetical protein SFW63_00580 [Alphaproteobacteria bacterium]|nr:hypothetical protein [Alphaproteobacteria bacterium]